MARVLSQGRARVRMCKEYAFSVGRGRTHTFRTPFSRKSVASGSGSVDIKPHPWLSMQGLSGVCCVRIQSPKALQERVWDCKPAILSPRGVDHELCAFVVRPIQGLLHVWVPGGSAVHEKQGCQVKSLPFPVNIDRNEL